jgi:hypothetical protein
MAFINKHSRYILLVIVLFLLVIGLYFITSKKAESPVTDASKGGLVLPAREITGNKDDLVSFSVNAGSDVSGILYLTGSVKNAYFFEGNIKVDLLDANKNIMKSGFGTATTEWTTTDPVSFTSTIDSTGLIGAGYILIQNDDPSGGEGGPSKQIFIPVVFKNIPTATSSTQ